MDDTLNVEENSSYADSQEIQTSDIDPDKKEYSSERIASKSKQSNDSKLRGIYESAADQELYEEILDKLDIKTKEKKQANQEDSIPPKYVHKNLTNEAHLENIKNISQVKTTVEKSIQQDFSKIQELVKNGLINSVQGQNLKKEVLKKAFDKLVQTEKFRRNLLSDIHKKQGNSSLKTQPSRENSIIDFSQNNPNFFNSVGRQEVLNYLKSGNVNLGKDELSKISDIVRNIEKSAIDRYLQKVAHEKTLRNSNENAKQRLTANAQKSSFAENFSRTFTREQIGKMSSAEFAKYESAIMDQLKKGQIR